MLDAVVTIWLLRLILLTGYGYGCYYYYCLEDDSYSEGYLTSVAFIGILTRLLSLDPSLDTFLEFFEFLGT